MKKFEEILLKALSELDPCEKKFVVEYRLSDGYTDSQAEYWDGTEEYHEKEQMLQWFVEIGLLSGLRTSDRRALVDYKIWESVALDCGEFRKEYRRTEQDDRFIATELMLAHKRKEEAKKLVEEKLEADKEAKEHELYLALKEKFGGV